MDYCNSHDSTVSLFSILFISVPFYQWRPNVSVSDLDDSVGSCVVVAVHPPFPNAFKHGVYAQLDHRPVKQFFFYYVSFNAKPLNLFVKSNV